MPQTLAIIVSLHNYANVDLILDIAKRIPVQVRGMSLYFPPSYSPSFPASLPPFHSPRLLPHLSPSHSPHLSPFTSPSDYIVVAC